MIGFYIILSLFATSVLCADHNTFRNCSRVSFCSKLRDQILDSSLQFSANVGKLQERNNIATIPLSNSKSEALNLQISLLNGNKIRVKILEQEHSRYELSEVLAKDPKVLPISINQLNDSSVIRLLPNVISETYEVVVNAGPPFTIEFYLDSRLEVVLNGDRLIMENTEDSQAFTFDVEFEGASKLYGLHHHAYKLALSETADGSTDPFRLRNSDTAGYEVNSPMALYGSVPVIYGHSQIDGNPIGLNVFVQQIIIHGASGDFEEPTSYTRTSEGTLLTTINLAEQLKMRKGDLLLKL